MKKWVFKSALVTIFLVAAIMPAEAQTVQLFQQAQDPVVASFLAAVNGITSAEASRQDKLTKDILAIASAPFPEGATDEQRELISQSRLLAINAKISSYTSASAFRIRRTSLIDQFQNSLNEISISLAPNLGAGLASFGFTFNRNERSRSVSEEELEGIFGTSQEFIKFMSNLVKGDSAQAILKTLTDVLSQAQVTSTQ